MKGFKSFLTESNKPSEKFEGAIIFCYNTIVDRPNDFQYFKRKAEKNEDVLDFLIGQKIDTVNEKPYRSLYNFGVDLISEIGYRGEGDSSISKSSPTVSSFWNDVTGKSTSEPKTDIMIGKDRISVKGEKGAVMSGGEKESLATFKTAIESTGVYQNSNIIGNVIEDLNSFKETVRTYGSDMNYTKLQDTNKSLLSKKNKDTERMTEEMEEMNDRIKGNLEKLFESKAIKNHFIFEALSGREKFGGKVMSSGNSGGSIGYTNRILIWKSDLSGLKYEPLLSPNSRIVNKITKNLNLRVRAKPRPRKETIGGIKNTVGYDIKQTIRMELEQGVTESKKFEDQIQLLETNLQENYITEINFKEKIGAIVSKMKSWWGNFVKKISETIERIKSFIKESLDNLLDYLGVDLVVQDNIRNKEVSFI